jgi:hypothetical protein
LRPHSYLAIGGQVEMILRVIYSPPSGRPVTV